MTALLLLSPGTPLLFQGQEFSCSRPFYYFADHEEDLSKMVHLGRSSFLKNFRSLANAEHDHFVDPAQLESFEKSKLDWSERERNVTALALHRDLLRLRREDPVFSAQRADRVYGAVLGDEVFALRFFGEADDDRLMFVNLGRDHHHSPDPEPLLAPPLDRRWKKLWSSADRIYGGAGTPEMDPDSTWQIPGHAAIVLTACREDDKSRSG
jgi:maltooligosyltrehalose trehalohydrolase